MQKFHSKTGLELVIPLGLVLGTVFFLMLFGEPGWKGAIFILALILFFVYTFATTYYIIEGNVLKIRCGFLYRSQIEISTIQRIKESNNPLSSPANSLDRLEIIYGKKQSVLISPKDKVEFVEQLQRIHPAIEFIPRKKRNK